MFIGLIWLDYERIIKKLICVPLFECYITGLLLYSFGFIAGGIMNYQELKIVGAGLIWTAIAFVLSDAYGFNILGYFGIKN